MNTATAKGSAFSKRSVLPVLWGTAFAVLVAWAGCGPSVTSSGGTGAGGSSGDTSVSTTVGPVTTSGTGLMCEAGPDCTGFPSPGSPCSVPGECCPYFMCDHAGGNYEQDVTCGDAGTWEW